MLYCSSGPHRRGYLRPGGHAGGAGVGLLHRAVPVPAAPAAGARPLVLLPDVQVPALLLLQELRLHRLSLLVRVFLWIQCAGNVFMVFKCRHGFTFICD